MGSLQSSRGRRAGTQKPEKPGEFNPPFPVVGVGASAGGLSAFRNFLEHLTSTTGMAYVLIPHLAPHHESVMPAILQKSTPLPVEEARDGMTVEPNHVYIVKPNELLVVRGSTLAAIPRAEDRKAEGIDHFFVSLARDYRDRAIGVILSGTASDGTEGLRAIKAEGGITFAQDDSAEFGDMPRNAIASGESSPSMVCISPSRPCLGPSYE